MPRFLAPHRAKTAVRRRINALRNRRNVHLLHIGKTGGTAIKAALGRNTAGRSGLITHPHEITMADIPEGDGIVFFVRDPVTRFCSGFFSRKRCGYPAHNKRWSAAERDAFERFDTPDALAVALTSDDPQDRQAAERAMHAVEHVRSSYWDWLIDEKTFERRIGDIVFIGQQEALDEDFAQLKRLLDWAPGIGLPVDPDRAHAGPAGEDRTLSTRAQHNLSDWYARDYQFLARCSRWRKDILRIPFRVEYEPAEALRDPST